MGHLDEVRVRVLLQRDVRAVAGAVVGLVPLRGDDEVPAELLEVHRQRVAAAERLLHVLVAVQPEHGPLRALLPVLLGEDLNERHLHTREQMSAGLFLDARYARAGR